MQDLFTWSTLGTYAGAVLATGIVTQLIKEVGFLKAIPTRAVSYVVALIILLAAMYFTDTLTFESAALCLINAAVVALAAQGGYEVVTTGLHKPKQVSENPTDTIQDNLDD